MLQENQITHLLNGWMDGDKDALSKLMPLIYNELRKIANYYLAPIHPNHDLQTTDLVHEAYLRIIKLHDINWNNRSHFFAVMAKIMRNILVNYALAQKTEKRGGKISFIGLEENMVSSQDTENT
ncbi:MAG: ECF subfamily RNA polymerase sigma-24 factor, partial [bacterium]